MIPPPQWTAEQLAEDCEKAIGLFREERLHDPKKRYVAAFDAYEEQINRLLEATDNLRALQSQVGSVLQQDLTDAFRYLGAPPISVDDLKTLADVNTLAAAKLEHDPESLDRIVGVVVGALDDRRFPWVQEGREPTDAERHAATIASAALLAASRVATLRRNEARKTQEDFVEAALVNVGWTKTASRKITHLGEAPSPGEFCRESEFGSAKADFVVGLRDHRKMAIECKVSNSSTNSVKRLNREAVGKAEGWVSDFGRVQVVPAAVLSGVFKLLNLQQAQARGLTIFWTHNIRVLLDWIGRTDAG